MPALTKAQAQHSADLIIYATNDLNETAAYLEQENTQHELAACVDDIRRACQDLHALAVALRQATRTQ